MTESHRPGSFGRLGCLRKMRELLSQEEKMKKLLLVFAACLLVFGVASQAQAFFDTGDLVRAMYDSQTGVEVVTDLGAISTLQGVTGYTNQADGTSNTVALTTFGTTATWSAVKTAYFANEL